MIGFERQVAGVQAAGDEDCCDDGAIVSVKRVNTGLLVMYVQWKSWLTILLLQLQRQCRNYKAEQTESGFAERKAKKLPDCRESETTETIGGGGGVRAMN